MRHVLLVACFAVGGIGLLITLMGLANVIDPNPGNQRYEIGLFLIAVGAPVAIIGLGSGWFVRKRDKR